MSPVSDRLGAQVKVTAMCGGSRVRDIASSAFTPARNRPGTPAATWSPSLKTARAGTFPVTVRCENGGTARTALTVG